MVVVGHWWWERAAAQWVSEGDQDGDSCWVTAPREAALEHTAIVMVQDFTFNLKL